MKKGFYLSALVPVLLISGCTLDIDIVGQGTVSSPDQSIACNEDCTKRSVGKVNLVTLNEQPASGYDFHGFVEDYKSSFESYVKVSAAPLHTDYGSTYMYMGDTQPNKWVSSSSKVTAIFLPIGSTQSEQKSFGSLCVINHDQSHECWGKSRQTVAKIKGAISEFIAEIGENEKSNQWCAIGDSGLYCWNENSLTNWQIPDSVGVPMSVALLNDIACVVHQGYGASELACFGENGKILENTPFISNPERVSTTENGQFCAENASEKLCWNASIAPQ